MHTVVGNSGKYVGATPQSPKNCCNRAASVSADLNLTQAPELDVIIWLVLGL